MMHITCVLCISNPVKRGFSFPVDVSCLVSLQLTVLAINGSVPLLLLTTAMSYLDFFHGKFGLLSLGKAGCDTVVLPNLWCMLGV